MWPERFGAKEVEAIKAGLGPYMASGRLQQSPQPKGGGIFKSEWWQVWEGTHFPVIDLVIASLDSAFTEKQENDPSALTVWGTFKHPETGKTRVILIEAWRKHLQMHGSATPRLEHEILQLGDDARIRRYKDTLWAKRVGKASELMDKARARCVCGCYLNIDDIFVEALKETRQAPVQAVIVLGDMFHGDLDEAMAHAKKLSAAGTRLFLFQQANSHSSYSEGTFQSLAEQNGGAFFKFNPAVERVAEKLPSLLHAVTRFAIGGMDALEALDDRSAVSLLEQMNTSSAVDQMQIRRGKDD
jgi:hypothetical protein